MDQGASWPFLCTRYASRLRPRKRDPRAEAQGAGLPYLLDHSRIQCRAIHREQPEERSLLSQLLGGENELVVVDDAAGRHFGHPRFPGREDQRGRLHAPPERPEPGQGIFGAPGDAGRPGEYLVFNDADFTYPSARWAGSAPTWRAASTWRSAAGSTRTPATRSPQLLSLPLHAAPDEPAFNRMANGILRLDLRDTRRGSRIPARGAAAIFARQSLNRFSFDLEVLFIARRMGSRSRRFRYGSSTGRSLPP